MWATERPVNPTFPWRFLARGLLARYPNNVEKLRGVNPGDWNRIGCDAKIFIFIYFHWIISHTDLLVMYLRVPKT
jgi:hypothetical protein